MESGSTSQTSRGISRERFAALFEEHSRLFWVVAASVTGDRGRAGDIVQDAAIVALGKLEQFQEGTSFQAWMCQIVRFVALNDARRLRPIATEQEHLDAKAARPSTEERGGASEMFADEVVKALGSLDATARECVLLKVIFDWPYARIAELLDIPEGTAMSHVHRSRSVLRKLLAGSYGGARSGGMA
jgi:RNA polymerase sigma-70 factor, ECF subfamily